MATIGGSQFISAVLPSAFPTSGLGMVLSDTVVLEKGSQAVRSHASAELKIL
jgi:hypothetical protein